MKMLKNTAKTAAKLKIRIMRELEYLGDVLQCLALITIIDEICYVKLANKKDLIKSIYLRRNDCR